MRSNSSRCDTIIDKFHEHVLLATMLAMILHICYVDELHTRSRMCDIDQPCRWSGDSSIFPDIGYESGNSRTVSLVGAGGASTRSRTPSRNSRPWRAWIVPAHIAVPPPF